MTTTTVPRAVLEQALEALEATHYDIGSAERQRLEAMDAITALRAALAQQEQEQDAEAWVDKGSIAWLGEQRSLQRRKVRSRREWQSLSEEEIWKDDRIMAENARCGLMMSDLSALARAIEQALKEKNA
jgi:hypothetical protein